MTDNPYEARVYIKQTIEGVARTAAELLVRLSRRVAAEGRPFRLALSGGSTPKLLYQLLVSETDLFRSEIPWDNILFFFGDERWVPHDSPQSNYKLANDELFVPLDIARDHIFPVPTEGLEPDEAATRYEHTILEAFGWKAGHGRFSGEEEDEDDVTVPEFDLILLGMGDEGHTASLFPHTRVLHENRRLVAATYVPKLSASRITFTPALLNSAANVAFMIGGAGKAEALRQVLEGAYNPDEYPAQLLTNSLGSVVWLVDSEAAAGLQGDYTRA